jgi:hypothetical protein
MRDRQTFGRRNNPQGTSRPQNAVVQSPRPETVAFAVPVEIAMPDTAESLDAELAAWRQARGSKFKMPWSQLSLVASLFFGVASFVLPDSVNDSVDWLLWGLSITSFCVWYSDRRKKKLTSPAAP